MKKIVSTNRTKTMVISNEHLQEASSSSRWRRFTDSFQQGCYQVLARTCYDRIARSFDPGRERAYELMNIQPEDNLLIIGIGSGLDLDYLPDNTNLETLRGLDYSSEMISKCRQRAEDLGISSSNMLQGDAQRLPFEEGQFNKIYFPLSLGSIPDPSLALHEAEKVLTPGGKIIVYEKVLDDDEEPSYGRQALNFFTQCIFTNINRRLSDMMKNTQLQVTHYEALDGILTGPITRRIESQYKIAVLEK
jgi:phosphatidylethanolamine/phosphatidyl-N-methylethanolamine N-methyltransferase